MELLLHIKGSQRWCPPGCLPMGGVLGMSNWDEDAGETESLLAWEQLGIVREELEETSGPLLKLLLPTPNNLRNNKTG